MSEPMRAMKAVDISHQVFGKYVHCTEHWGLWYSDEDFSGGFGMGRLKWGAIPSPYGQDRRPWRGVGVELYRRMRGAKRER
jgi:hypothetical protein